MEKVWEIILDELIDDLKKENLDIWFLTIKDENVKLYENKLEIKVPNNLYISKIAEKEEIIKNKIKSITGKDIVITYIVEEEKIQNKESEYISFDREIKKDFDSKLNKEYTFDDMVISQFNQFAALNSKRIADKNSKDKILFIYSNPGLGKTHMLHAIGNEIERVNPAAKVLYITAEDFVNEYIDSIKQNKVDSFRNKYRNLDCLLIDDVQFIVAKERSEEEFFHTFNALTDYGKKIVITSDRPPGDINVNERLISRFKSGLIADIKHPEYEARVAILAKENDKYKYNIPEDVIKFVAENVKDSIRSLKACLSTIHSYSQYAGEYPTIDRAKEWIKDFITLNTNYTPQITVEDIQNIVAHEYGVTVDEIKSKQRSERLAFPRQIAIYIACEITTLSLPEIGKKFNKDHSTIIHARDKIKHLLNSDPFFSEKINNLINRIKNKNVN